MERKKKYTVEEAAAIILRDVPLDNAMNTDIEHESDDLDISNIELFFNLSQCTLTENLRSNGQAVIEN